MSSPSCCRRHSIAIVNPVGMPTAGRKSHPNRHETDTHKHTLKMRKRITNNCATRRLELGERCEQSVFGRRASSSTAASSSFRVTFALSLCLTTRSARCVALSWHAYWRRDAIHSGAPFRASVNKLIEHALAHLYYIQMC